MKLIHELIDDILDIDIIHKAVCRRQFRNQIKIVNKDLRYYIYKSLLRPDSLSVKHWNREIDFIVYELQDIIRYNRLTYEDHYKIFSKEIIDIDYIQYRLKNDGYNIPIQITKSVERTVDVIIKHICVDLANDKYVSVYSTDIMGRYG